MLLYRGGARLSAAALHQGFSANRRLTLLRNDRAFHRHRAVCVSAAGGLEPTLSPRGDRQADHLRAVQKWDSSPSSPGSIFTPVLNLSRRQQQSGVSGGSRGYTQPLVIVHASRRRSRGEAAGGALFSAGGGEGCCSTTTMQARASSTSTHKQEEQNLKEPSSTSSSSPKAPGEAESEDGKLNKTQQLKKVFKEYGAVGVSFHIGMSLVSLGMFYVLVSSGIDMTAVLCKVGFSEAVVQSKMAAGTSTFVLAYAVHKLFAPVRISITLVSVPLIVRYLRKTGLFKPPAP